uniref:Large ribosomal subunit protein bL33c n=1 Tax=Taenioma perpusillum TaxID=210852 RepID=A0A1Z1MS22_9FLOR|nr:ribosomal protein L33 [Taenioma perpusillum]ARW68504.1 ribosomal protein L33 [Taenioma perpusillum]
MAKSKGSRITITLECQCENNQGKRGVCRYTTSKNKKNNPTRLELKKFCHHCNTHMYFKEIK